MKKLVERLFFMGLILLFLSGCVTRMKNIESDTHAGMTKERFFNTMSTSLELHRIYYNPKTNIEAYQNLKEMWWNEGDKDTIIIFQNVTEPNQCPFSSSGFCGVFAEGKKSKFLPGKLTKWMGNGELLVTLKPSELLGKNQELMKIVSAAVYESERLRKKQVQIVAERRGLTKYPRLAYIEWLKEGRELQTQRAKANQRRNAAPQAKGVITSPERTALLDSEDDVFKTDFKAFVDDLLSPSLKSKTAPLTKKNYTPKARRPQTANNNIKPKASSNESGLLGKILDTAVDLYFEKKKLEYKTRHTKKELKKIEEASRKGMRRALRKERLHRQLFNTN